MNWRERITIDPKILVGKPIIKGTRIAVEFVVDLLGRGWTFEQILDEYDHLQREDLQACLAYASEVIMAFSPPADWLDRVIGSMKDEPAFDEILAHGRAIREADRPAEDQSP